MCHHPGGVAVAAVRYSGDMATSASARWGVLVGLAAATAVAADGLATRLDYLLAGDFPAIRASLDVRTRKPVGEVTADHFEVLEDGKPVEDLAVRLNPEPIRLTLVLDRSGSLQPVMGELKRAVWSFLRAMPRDAFVRVISFSSSPRVDRPFTTRKSELLAAVKKLEAYGPTALYDGVVAGLEVDFAAAGKGRRVVVVFTDGVDQNESRTGPQSTATARDVVERARARRTPVHVVAMGKEINRKHLAKLAKMTGGSFFLSPSVRELAKVFARVKAILSASYLLGWTTPRPARDGTWRAVKVRSRLLGFEDQAEGKYRAPEPAPTPEPAAPPHAAGRPGGPRPTPGCGVLDSLQVGSGWGFARLEEAKPDGGTGTWSKTASDGSLHSECEMIDGRCSGIRRHYFAPPRGGGLYEEYEARGKRRVGSYRMFFPDGAPNEEAAYDEAGRRHGVRRRYRRTEQGGSMCLEETYVEGALDGVVREFFDDGSLGRAASYSAGQQDGLDAEYRPGGVALFRLQEFDRGAQVLEAHYDRAGRFTEGQLVVDGAWVNATAEAVQARIEARGGLPGRAGGDPPSAPGK